MAEREKILVFGAAGFIGTYLIDALIAHGHEVVSTDISESGQKYYSSKKIQYVAVDITTPSDFDKLPKDVDTVIHLAALQPANFNKKYTPKDYIDINVIGTANVLEFCRKNDVKKIIYASSHRNTSGLWHKKVAIKESDGRALQYEGEYSMFSISESAAQDCVDFYTANYGIQGIIFRLPPVYGYGPHLEIFKGGKPIKTGFQIFIENAEACKPLEIWGDPTVGRDIIYIKDVIDAFIKAIDHSTAKGLFNITSNHLLTLQEQVETIAKVFWGDTSKPIFVFSPDKKNAMDSFQYDNAKAQKELGWKPKYNFEQMLEDYKKERDGNKFTHLVEKRKDMLKGES